MKVGAIKCTACGSYRNWRRYSGEISSLFALIIAGVAVFAWAEPILKKYVIGYKDEIRAVYSGAYINGTENPDGGHSLKGLSIVISNTGDRPAYISEIAVNFKVENVGGAIYLNDIKEEYQNSSILHSGESYVFRRFLTQAIALPAVEKIILSYDDKEHRKDASCRLNIDWISFDGKSKKEIQPMDNSNCGMFLKLAQMRLSEISAEYTINPGRHAAKDGRASTDQGSKPNNSLQARRP